MSTVERLNAHIAMMAPHQKERDGGKLLIEATHALKEVTKERDSWIYNAQQLQKQVNEAEPERAKIKAELADANYWRERHSKDAEAYGKQSQANWERAEKAERACAEMRKALLACQRHIDILSDATPLLVRYALSSTCGQGYINREELDPAISCLSTLQTFYKDYPIWNTAGANEELERLRKLKEAK